MPLSDSQVKAEQAGPRRRNVSVGDSLKTVLGGSESVINIRDNKLEKMIDEILKKTHYSSPIEYLEDRIKRDHATVMRNKEIG